MIVRTLFQRCKLVHADLSEYNILYHEKNLWIIDVSQSVEHDHPYALEFLRKDCLNINLFFKKYISQILSLRLIFDFVVQAPSFEETSESSRSSLISLISSKAQSSFSYKEEIDEKVFLESYIPRTLDQVIDIERDLDRVTTGDVDDLLYMKISSISNIKDGKHCSNCNSTTNRTDNNSSLEDEDDSSNIEELTSNDESENGLEIDYTVPNESGNIDLSNENVVGSCTNSNLDKLTLKQIQKQHKKLVKASNRLRRQNKMEKSEKKRLCKAKTRSP